VVALSLAPPRWASSAGDLFFHPRTPHPVPLRIVSPEHVQTTCFLQQLPSRVFRRPDGGPLVTSSQQNQNNFGVPFRGYAMGTYRRYYIMSAKRDKFHQFPSHTTPNPPPYCIPGACTNFLFLYNNGLSDCFDGPMVAH
jgi:hypothetical protein